MFTNEKIMELIMKSNVDFNETINKKDMTYCVYEDVHMNNSKVVKLEDATNYLIKQDKFIKLSKNTRDFSHEMNCKIFGTMI